MYKGISQYEVNHMENLMVRDDCWNDDHIDVRSYCDIYSCRECPRCGDDCDGELDDDEEEDEDGRIAYYEKQGDEYVYYDENECELFREPA